MVEDVVARSKAALEGTTDAPWVVDSGERWINGGDRGYDEVIWPGQVECMSYCYGGSSTIDGDRLPQDMRFIAAARELIPELIAEVERLRAQYTEVRLTAERLRYDNRTGVDDA